jgi:hypothetical protein
MVGTIFIIKMGNNFCENETNNRKIYNVPNEVDYKRRHQWLYSAWQSYCKSIERI